MSACMDVLVDPRTKEQLKRKGMHLVSAFGNHYPILNEIPVFIEERESKPWDQYYTDIYTNIEPQPPHPYYVRFTDGWGRMLDVGSGDGVMSAGSAYKVQQI